MRPGVGFERVLPLDPHHTRALVLEFRDVGRSSFVGTVATALVQGVLGGVGYALAGLSSAVPGVAHGDCVVSAIAGHLAVWVGVSVYLAFQGHLLPAVAGVGLGLLHRHGPVGLFHPSRLVGGGDHGHPC